MIYLFYTIHVLNCFFLILVVLLQQGKGADLSVFGGGSTMTAFGARGAATLLHQLTVFGFVGFIVTTLTIGILQGRLEGSSVMSAVDDEAGAVAEESTDDAAAELEEPLTGLLAEPEEETVAADEATAEATAEDGVALTDEDFEDR